MVPAIFDLNAEAGHAVARDTGGRFYAVDVTDAASVAAGIAEASEDLGTIRVAVSCAGIAPAAKTVSRGRRMTPRCFPRPSP
jgi:NAD(P)-dependent dehydrogenase (short-subunit alcohol dehydrogenase family)